MVGELLVGAVEPHTHGQHEQDPRCPCPRHPGYMLSAWGEYQPMSMVIVKELLRVWTICLGLLMMTASMHACMHACSQVFTIIIAMPPKVLAGWLQIYRGTKYSRFPRFL